MNEFEAHESSYDHQHKKVCMDHTISIGLTVGVLTQVFLQRLKEMKQMQRDPLASTKARKAERKADEKSGLITIKPVKLDSQPGGGGFKKGGFKNAFGGGDEEKKDSSGDEKAGLKKVLGGGSDGAGAGAGAGQQIKVKDEMVESDTDEEEYEHYDPYRPTDCFEGCRGRH